MAGTDLVLHTGAREVGREELMLVEAPAPTKTWYPIAHGKVLSAVEELLGESGFSIAKARYGLSRGDAQFFGTLDLRSSIANGVTLAVGIRNSTNQTLPLGFVAGSRVFVCDNLAFRSELLVNRKHTLNGGARFREAIVHAVKELETFREVEHKRIELMRATEIDDVRAESFMLRAFDRNVVSHRVLRDVINGWYRPEHEAFGFRTLWSLYNAFTGALASRARSNPQAHSATTMRVSALLAPTEN